MHLHIAFRPPSNISCNCQKIVNYNFPALRTFCTKQRHFAREKLGSRCGVGIRKAKVRLHAWS
jgi:hypothetical protein